MTLLWSEHIFDNEYIVFFRRQKFVWMTSWTRWCLSLDPSALCGGLSYNAWPTWRMVSEKSSNNMRVLSYKGSENKKQV